MLRSMIRPLALAAIVSGCGAATIDDTATAEEDAHFPPVMPMVTYYDPVPEGPMGSAVDEAAVDDRTAELIPKG